MCELRVGNKIKDFVLSMPQCPTNNVKVGLVDDAINVVFDNTHLVQLLYDKEPIVYSKSDKYNEIKDALYANIDTLAEMTTEYRNRYRWGENYPFNAKEFLENHPQWRDKNGCYIGRLTVAAAEMAEYVGKQVALGKMDGNKWREELKDIMIDYEPYFYGQSESVANFYMFEDYVLKGYNKEMGF